MKPNIAPSSVWKNPIHFITFGFGSGAMPYAPGTFGTLAAIPFYLLIQPLSLEKYLIILVLITLLGIWLCGKTCREIGEHDHPGTVFDEFVGFGYTMIAAPQGFAWVIVGFILFRIFDIWKPYPIKWLDENVHGGFGVVLDDIVAGIYACVFLQIIALPFR